MLARSKFVPTTKGENRDSPLWKPHREKSPRSGLTCLLELGSGFAFVGRQKRLTLDGDHFYVDLVVYHTVLHAYIIIDLKTKPLTHADLGQMQLYVNYFDMEIKTEKDSPTIGLVLCTKQNKKMVRYFLGDKSKNIFASKYQFHLPTEK